MAKTPHSQGRGPGLDPCSGNWIPHAATKTSHATAEKKKKEILHATKIEDPECHI